MMRSVLRCIAASVAILACGTAVQAQTLVYSFETENFDGFFGLGATTTQDTIGATNGTKSLKYAAGAGGFVGARTETVIPPALGNPPGIDYVLFDLTVTEDYAGAFGDIGITFFGHALNANPQQFGLQAQFAGIVSFADLLPGTYTDMRIDLTSATNPVTGETESFNQIFGPGADQVTVASAFQFFMSKAADPATVYIDNVRTVGIPEPATVALFGLGAVGLGVFARRRSA